MKYIIIKGQDIAHLEQLVDLAMGEGGFVPLGGVCVLIEGYAYQAMIEETPNAKD